MFDLTETIELVIPSDEGDKICEISQPTDEQWTARYNKRFTLIRNLGNGYTEQKQMNREAADSALLKEIQLNTAITTFDESEAIVLMDQLSTCEVVDVIRTGGSLEIQLNTVLGEVKHFVKMPKYKDLKYTMDAGVRVKGGRLNTSTVHINLPPYAELYNTIAERVEGYNPAKPTEVPIIHKYKVIDVIQGEIQNIGSTIKTKGATKVHPIAPGLPSQG